MNIEPYLTKKTSYNTYSFDSIGPKGRIELRIVISKDDQEKVYPVYNLAFGAWDHKLNDIDDTVEIRNGDMDQILAKVGHTALEFIKANPGSSLYVQGSTPKRTRKYQMGISKYMTDIPSELGILGLVGDKQIDEIHPTWKWEHFQSGTNYHALLLYSK